MGVEGSGRAGAPALETPAPPTAPQIDRIEPRLSNDRTINIVANYNVSYLD